MADNKYMTPVPIKVCKLRLGKNIQIQQLGMCLLVVNLVSAVSAPVDWLKNNLKKY